MPVPKPEIAVAAVILEQLGGRHFLAMTGAKHLLAYPSALSFRLPSSFAKKGINYVRIELNVMDLYNITFRVFVEQRSSTKSNYGMLIVSNCEESLQI